MLELAHQGGTSAWAVHKAKVRRHDVGHTSPGTVHCSVLGTECSSVPPAAFTTHASMPRKWRTGAQESRHQTGCRADLRVLKGEGEAVAGQDVLLAGAVSIRVALAGAIGVHLHGRPQLLHRLQPEGLRAAVGDERHRIGPLLSWGSHKIILCMPSLEGELLAQHSL